MPPWKQLEFSYTDTDGLMSLVGAYKRSITLIVRVKM